MSNKLQPDRVSPETAERERKRSVGRHKLKKVSSGTNGSDHQSVASATDNSLSKPAPESLPTGLQKKGKEAIASNNNFIVRIDAATNAVTVNGDCRLFGTKNEDSTRALTKQVLDVLNAEGKHDLQNSKWALETIHGIGPKDELEGLLAAQMIVVHSSAMKFLTRASLEGQPTFVIDANINRFTKLIRTFTSLMEALNRHRGKVGQQMVVGNVNVSDGGQAIVGQVSRDGQGKAPTEDVANRVE